MTCGASALVCRHSQTAPAACRAASSSPLSRSPILWLDRCSPCSVSFAFFSPRLYPCWLADAPMLSLELVPQIRVQNALVWVRLFTEALPAVMITNKPNTHPHPDSVPGPACTASFSLSSTLGTRTWKASGLARDRVRHNVYEASRDKRHTGSSLLYPGQTPLAEVLAPVLKLLTPVAEVLTLATVLLAPIARLLAPNVRLLILTVVQSDSFGYRDKSRRWLTMVGLMDRSRALPPARA